MQASYQNYFKDKRITVMGLGLLGRSVGDALYLAEAGAALVTVTDLKSEAVLAESVAKLRDFPNVEFVLGEHRFDDFVDRDFVVVSAGVPLDSPYLARAREAGVRLVQSAALFAELSEVPVIGVTGTRGKSTVTHMIHHVLTQITGEQVILGGNVRGVSNLQLLHEVRDDSLAVMELDSWQLQGWGWSKRSPQVAVFTNFMEDHLNYYHGDMDAYFRDKANIFRYQHETDIFITTPEVFARAQTFAQSEGITLGQEVVLVDASVLPEDMLLAIPGDHNRLNAALAYEALRALSLEPEAIFEALSTFPGVSGRLERAGTLPSGARVYNDNNATTPSATVAGLKAVANGQNVLLIAGGSFKDVDPAPLLPAFAEYCKQVYLLPGTGTDVLLELAAKEGALPANIVPVSSLEAAVAEATAAATAADVVLFSPGFASFGLFKNEYERNDAFVEALAPHLDREQK